MNRNLGALNKQTKLYTSPNLANKETGYICLDCAKDLVFCKGKIKPPYFRHKANVNNPCTYYNNSPSESQIHIDGKYKLKSILENKNVTIKRCCDNCNSCKEYKIPKCKQDSKIVIEYSFQFNNSRKQADVACIDNRGSLNYIIEICNTNSTWNEERENVYTIVKDGRVVKIGGTRNGMKARFGSYLCL